ncbi:Yip1 family protein [Paramaledivibacter caminithermalis]|jgi:hypothetical protein|uniref:Yip1 domain-containing protein n=1 Tax=Paramaledivibacter caminithermalis (strain DSM 15212 / CIP 107654 / DViRD3) TaxID=1121301 RepID=A0A1M6L8S1_PARC5|nr:Yip1 family protein [Paramaledivibacter caminithermalis]SHJ67590.1 Yip1 domain-containing protein [Paramaledivibacter caminithermalis DSM 15212]
MSDDGFINTQFEEDNEESKLSFFQRFVNVFVNPIKVMEDISIKPTLLFAILPTLLVFTLLNVLKIDLLKEFTLQQMELNPNSVEIPEEIMMTTVYIASISASIMPIIMALFKGLISHGITRLFDGKGDIKQSLSVIFFSYFIVMLGEIIKTIICLLTQSYFVTISLASVIPNLEFNTPLYNLMTQFDIFILWYLIVSMIGISVVHRISKGKAAVAVFGPWSILIVYHVVLAIIMQ